MFLTYRSGLQLNGQNPTLLYGYGGFNISETPSFRVDRLVWMEMGGVFAHANLRGGGEYGEAWHQAGTKTNKQNVFDDFIAAGEFLISEGYTSTPRLAIQGGSNGGLSGWCGAHPEARAFRGGPPGGGRPRYASLSHGQPERPPMVQRLRTERKRRGVRALYAYSPYHNVREGTCYPPTLVTTAHRDDRVVPWNSFKFAAALQHGQGCENPILMRVETRAGHGAGKPTWMRIEEVADAWAFLKWALDF